MEWPRSAQLFSGLWWVFVVLATTSVIVPLTPIFPSEGFESQWYAAVNQAVAQRLAFGRDMIFTHGPYASIANLTFHPDTDVMMIMGSSMLALGYASLLFLAARTSAAYWLLPYVLILSSYSYPRDVLLFTYCLLLMIAAYRLATRCERSSPCLPSRTEKGLFLAAAAVLGLLPLIKGSALFLVAGSMAVSLFILALSEYWALATGVLLLPIVSAFIFWWMAGQPWSALPDFLLSLVPLTSGYTEAMAFPGNWIEVGLYLLAALVSLGSLLLSGRGPTLQKAILTAGYAAFLFVAFKAGFVRAVAAVTSGTALILGALMVSSLVPSRFVLLSLVFATIAWGAIDRGHLRSSPKSLFTNCASTFTRAVHGAIARAGSEAAYAQEFQRQEASIARGVPLPHFEGTTDIYSFLQGYLLASPNTWSPRPVFQSYAAYTPSLLRANAGHLTGDRAPDNVLFRIEPIDCRLPSLEDGMSWPILLSRYSVGGFIGQFVHLVKQSPAPTPPKPTLVYEGVHTFGESIPVPVSKEPIFAEFDIAPNVLGRIGQTLFKLPRINIVLTFMDGHTEVYCFISGMGKTPFLLSPRVSQNLEFVLLTAEPKYLDSSRVKTVQFITRSWLWRSSIPVRLSTVSLQKPSALSGLDLFDPVMTNASELGTVSDAECDGAVDEVNGAPASAPNLTSTGTLTVRGWVAVSAKDGIASDAVFVTLTDATSRQTIVRARKTPRPDVQQYFGRPDLAAPGFEAFIDIGNLTGTYTLGLYRRYQDRVAACRRLTVPITIQ